MNAFLMAAGNGMRLRPLTEDIQKCMLPVGGKPMLEWWLDAVFRANCFDKVFVNVHHCADKVEGWIWRYCEVYDRRVQIIDERSKLLGTAGTIYWHGDSDNDFMVAYTDTFSEEFFLKMGSIAKRFSKLPTDCIAGVMAFFSPRDGSAGLMKIDEEGRVTEFMEKEGRSNEAWAGILFARKNFYDEIGPQDRDLARDVLPRMKNRLLVFGHVDAYDIGRGVDIYEQFNKKILST